MFAKARTSSRHGLGLVVGGKKSEMLSQALAALKQSQDENKDLRRMVESLKESQKNLVEKSELVERNCNEMVERKCNEMMLMFLASQNQNSTPQEDSKKQNSARQEDAVTSPPDLGTKDDQLISSELGVDKRKQTVKAKNTKLLHPEVTSTTVFTYSWFIFIELHHKKYNLQIEGTNQRFNNST